MKKLLFVLFLIFSVLITAKAQNSSVIEFYTYLNTILENDKNKTIELLMNNYGCLGSNIYSEAKLIQKKSKIEIQYYSLIQDLNSKDLFEKKLDTTFVVSKKALIQNFKNEMKLFDSRVVYLEATYKFIVKTANSESEFMLIKADGLYYLLRFNKTFEVQFKDWSKKRNAQEKQQIP